MQNDIFPDNSRDENETRQLATPDDIPEIFSASSPAQNGHPKTRAAVLSALALAVLVAVGFSLRQDSTPAPTILNAAATAPYRDYQPQPGKTSAPTIEAANPATNSQTQTIKVHVAGLVKKPGVYALPTNARVQDAIAKAGGALEDADVNAINLAQWAEDGSRIDIPRKETPTPPEKIAPNFAPRSADVSPQIAPRLVPRSSSRATKSTSPTTKGVRSKSGAHREAEERILLAKPIDINRADAQTLDALPGVGPATAQKILDYRKENGAFKSADDLDEVKGIGPAKLEKMRPFVVVR